MDADAVRKQVERILKSEDFAATGRLRNFLTFVVEETLAGRGNRLKAYAIAREVFGRGDNFDTMNDPVVRIEAGRLRRALERYYLLSGREDPIRIDIPKGTYIPTLQWTGRELSVEADVDPEGMPAPPTQTFWARHWRIGQFAVVLSTVLLLILAVVGGRTGLPKRLPSPEITIEVLPFANLSGAPGALYTSGISDELLTQLARFRDLKVVGGLPNAPGQGASATDLAAGPRYLLAGGVRVAGEQLRVSARLIDRQSWRIVWSQIYDRTLRGAGSFEIEADIAAKVAAAVAQPYGAIFAPASQNALTQTAGNAEAYLCVLRFYHYRKVLDREEHAATRDCLERTVADYPAYSTGWAMLAYLYLDEDRFDLNRRGPSPAGTDRARQAAERAVELDGTNARALQALMTVLFFSRMPDAALEIGAKALALNPNDTEILAEFGSRIAQAGAWKRGAAMMEDALARNPSQASYYMGLVALAYYMMGNDQLAVEWIKRADLPRFSFYHFVGAIIFARAGLEKERAESVDQFLKMRPRFFDNFAAELAMRNFTASDREKLTEAARRAGFPVGKSN
ncbi:adenylate cyclase [Bosea sp. NPDC055332]